MSLTEEEITFFFKLYHNLLWKVNENNKIIPSFIKANYPVSRFPMIDAETPVSMDDFLKLRSQLWDNRKLIDEFLEDKDNGIENDEEREIISDWRKFTVKDSFVVIKHHEKYSVFMSSEGPTKLYAVHGISDPIEYLLMFKTPVYLDAILIPFKGIIIWDGIVVQSKISFGPGITSSLNKQYKELKAEQGIVKQFGVDIPEPDPIKEGQPKTNLKDRESSKSPKIVTAAKKTTKNAKTPKQSKDVQSDDNFVLGNHKVPPAMIARFNEIGELISQFWDERSNDDMKQLSLKALAKLSRKRPSPIVTGKPKTWAAGISYAIGSINFIFDQSKKDTYVSAETFAKSFGLAKSTIAGQARTVRKILNLSYFSTEYTVNNILNGMFSLFPLFPKG
jgi:hypothetical protein